MGGGDKRFAGFEMCRRHVQIYTTGMWLCAAMHRGMELGFVGLGCTGNTKAGCTRSHLMGSCGWTCVNVFFIFSLGMHVVVWDGKDGLSQTVLMPLFRTPGYRWVLVLRRQSEWLKHQRIAVQNKGRRFFFSLKLRRHARVLREKNFGLEYEWWRIAGTIP